MKQYEIKISIWCPCCGETTDDCTCDRRRYRT